MNGCTNVPHLISALSEVFQFCGTLICPLIGCAATYFFPVPWQVWAEDKGWFKCFTHNYIRIQNFCLRQHFNKSFDELARSSEFWKEAIKGNYIKTMGLPNQASCVILTKNDTLPPSSSLSAGKGSRRMQ